MTFKFVYSARDWVKGSFRLLVACVVRDWGMILLSLSRLSQLYFDLILVSKLEMCGTIPLRGFLIPKTPPISHLTSDRSSTYHFLLSSLLKGRGSKEVAKRPSLNLMNQVVLTWYPHPFEDLLDHVFLQRQQSWLKHRPQWPMGFHLGHIAEFILSLFI